ncbi:hypothetical protein GALL_530900 [mine drainage metagenome]|uniref:Uncharacterized protein n=1 Tax=mine drainage metagenome TaxID=410659 RepID=A0A1J5P3U7_9ZZZZ
MTLWLPLLDFARSYAPMVQQALTLLPAKPSCLATLGLTPGQTAALEFHGHLTLKPEPAAANCSWLMVTGDPPSIVASLTADRHWLLKGAISHPADPKEKLYLFEKQRL